MRFSGMPWSLKSTETGEDFGGIESQSSTSPGVLEERLELREDGGVSVRLSASLLAGLLFAEAWSCTLGWNPRSGEEAAAVMRLSGILLPWLAGKRSAETKLHS